MNDNNIMKFLVLNNAPMHLKGFVCLCRSIEIVSLDYNKVFSIEKEVYSVIARENHSTTDRVNRNIRTVIESMFNRGDDKLYSYFNYISESKGKPTNKEFIAVIASMFK